MQPQAQGRLDMDVEVRDKDGNLRFTQHLVGYVGGPSMQDAEQPKGETHEPDSLDSGA